MDITLLPTKGNLIAARNTLALSTQGYDLLDKKRNILIREMLDLIDRARDIQSRIEKTFVTAYAALQRANIAIGIEQVEKIGHALSIEESIKVLSRSVMGTQIPMVTYQKEAVRPRYGFYSTASSLDEACVRFSEVKQLSIELAEVETTVYRLAINIKKTQKRANALKNVTIPKYRQICAQIGNALEEKDREEFTRLKVIKGQKQRGVQPIE